MHNLASNSSHQALLNPGDALFLPAMWLRSASPTADMDVAANPFFRGLERAYSTGRDVYRNRDLAAYEKG